MKKLIYQFLPLALALSLIGCTAIPVEEIPADSSMLAFEATIVSSEADASDPATRTGNLPSGKVYWCPGDEISVFSGKGENGGSKFISNATENEFTTTFAGTLDAGVSWSSSSTFWAVYPYAASNRFDGSSVYAELSAEQRSAAGSLSGGQLLTIARSSGYSLEFYNICSGIRFTVANEGIRSVTFRNIDGGVISGTVKASFDWSGKPQFQAISGGSDEITVTPETGGTFVVGTEYYAVLPVVRMSRGIEVTYKTATAKAVYTNSANISFARGRFKSLPARDKDLKFESSVKVFNLENASITSYFDDAESKYTDTNWSSVSVVETYCSNSSSNRKDFPAPVSLSWTAASGSGDYTVSIYNDAACTDLEMSQNTSSTSANIYNLIPKRTYYYTVTRNSSKVADGTFATEGRRRMMRVSDTYARGHANNCRDLGGMKTVDGHTLKHGIIFRGSNMDSTTDAEKQYLTGYMNIGMDIDLRAKGSSGGWGGWGGWGGGSGSFGADGSQKANEPFGSSWGVEYSNAGYDSWEDLSNRDKTKTTFTDIIKTVKSGKATYIHCYVGADRTGYICMLLEAVLGVSARDCSMDYELTSFSVVGLRDRTGKHDDYYFTKGINYISGYSGSTFKEKAENILLDAGITSQQIADLRNAMIE